MAAPTHVLTISRVAEILDEDKDWLYELARKMEPEDGMTHHLTQTIHDDLQPDGPE